MKKFAKFIRILTVAPIAAAIMLTILFLIHPELYKNTLHYFVGLGTLTLMPLAAYPISLVWNKEKRRDLQRSLAIYLSISGYITGFLFAFFTGSPSSEKIIYLTYLLSGASIAVFSFVLKKKSSGHACGVAGPVAMLMYYVSPLFSVAFTLLIPVFWASLKMKRHTVSQLISGCAIPIVSMMVSILTFGSMIMF